MPSLVATDTEPHPSHHRKAGVLRKEALIRGVRGDSNRPRAGQDYRKGKDVTADEFREAFNFRGVEFGNWVGQGANEKERQGMINAAFDALHDLAAIVGIPPKAISLNGTLGLGFGSRGKGNAAAHFEPGNLVINLTKTKGAGTLAHEWFHALDNYFSRQRGGEVKMQRGLNAQQEYRQQNFITYRAEPLYVHKTKPSGIGITKAKLDHYGRTAKPDGYYHPSNWQIDPSHPQGVRPEVERSFAGLVEALDASPMKVRADMNDSGADGYWGRIIERGARAFENYVINKMMQGGYHNDYLANVRDVESFTRSKDRYPYLLPAEVAPIAEAFDALFGVIETKETDSGNVVLFSRGVSGASADGKFLDRGAVNQLAIKTVGESSAASRFVFTNYGSLPIEIRDEAASQGVKPGELKAAHWNGKTYMVDGRFTSAKEAKQAIFHEHYVHFGLRAKYENELGPKLRTLLEGVGGLDGVRELARQQGIDLSEYEKGVIGNKDIPESKQPLILIEELMAHMGHATGTLKQFIQEAVGAIRAWMRKSGYFELSALGVTDLANELRMARKAAQKAGDTKADADVNFMFAGRKSFSADMVTIKEAQTRLDAGAQPDAVRRDTGWFKGVDGKWRFEIADDEASLKDMPVTYSREEFFNRAEKLEYGPRVSPSSMKASEFKKYMKFREDKHAEYASLNGPRELQSILDHPKLFAAYPDLANMEVTFVDPASSDYRGMYYPAQDKIELSNTGDMSAMRSTLLHEIQHAIQKREGFAKGGNTDENFVEAVKRALKNRSVNTAYNLNSWKFDNLGKVIAAEKAAEAARYGLMYESATRLLDYSRSYKPSGLFRNVRQEMQWLYHEQFRGNQVANDIQRLFYDMPKRHNMQKRNNYISDMAFRAGSVLRDQIPAELLEQFKNDPRTMKGMLKALERESSKAEQQLAPMLKLDEEARKLNSIFEKKRYVGAYEIYRTLAGEVEARNTQARLGMNDEQRKNASIQSTADVDMADVIVMFGGMDVRAPMNMADKDQKPAQSKTDTAAFKEWFADSKVVDADGKPLVVYHGTTSDFESFDREKVKTGVLGHGFYFASRPESTRTYSGGSRFGGAGYADGGNVMPVYLSIKNPMILKRGDKADAGAEAKGHDGVIQLDAEGNIHTLVAFRPEQIKSAVGNNGNYDKTNPNINYRINSGSAAGIPPFSAKAFAKKLNAVLGDKIRAVATEEELPPHLLEQIKADKMLGRVAGLYDKQTGQSWLIAANIDNVKHAVEVMLHEAVGHGGVQAVLGDKLGKVMQGIYRDMPKAIRAELERRYATKLEGLSQTEREIEVAEEYVAHMAETDPRSPFISRLVAQVRKFLREVFGEQVAMKWTRNDIVQLLAEARSSVSGNNGGGKGNSYREKAEQHAAPELAEVTEADEAEFVASLKGPAVASMAKSLYQSRGTDSPFFRNWFGNSRMVKDGKPIAFYHRSHEYKEVFDDARLGGNTGTPTAALGHYLSIKDENNVERYGPVSDRFYIKMEKPKVISQAQFSAMGDWPVDKAKAYRENLMAQGFDGLYVNGLGWPIVFEGKNIKGVSNNGTFDETNRTRYSISDDTRAAFESRIDELFAGAKPRQDGVRVLDRSDVLDLLGYGDYEVVLSEGHGVDDGRFNHPQFTAADWKQVPEWLENPVAVFERSKDGHLTIIAPSIKNGNPIIIAIKPDAGSTKERGRKLHVLLSAYDKDNGRMPLERMVRDGELRYIDHKKTPEFNRGTRHQLPRSGEETKGYDTKIYTGADLFKYRKAESSGGIRYSVTGDTRALFDRAFGPAPIERNDPFAAENRRLREGDKTLWQKAKKEFARQFAPGGLLPESVFNEKITRDSEFQAVEFEVRHMSNRLSQAVKADFGVDIDNLTAEQMKPLAEALSGKVDPAIPEGTRVAIVAMRQYIDSLSGEYLSILQKQVEANMQGADQALIDKITGNLGAYVNRSYQAFDDPKWFKTVPTEVINTARTYLAAGYMEQGESAKEAARLADVTVNEMLKTGTAYDSMGAFIAEGKLGAKDLTVLIKRKEIAPEIRALLGEYTDPRLNFAKSATKMGRLVWNQRFLDRVLDFGMGTFLFEGKDRPADATTQIAGDKSETYAPLNGLWTYPEVAQAFVDALGKEQMSDLYRTIVRLNGMVKYGKTVLSPTTAMRNWQSAMFFSLANGHFDLSQMKHSWAALREQVTQNATGKDLTYLHKLKRLGVVYDTPYAGEMMALLQDARMDELLSSKSGTGLKWLRKVNQFAQGFYSFGDDFWKIIGYENEKASLIAAGIPEAEAETMAAKRIRNTYPTYSMIGKAVQWLRRFPLAGTFVSFPSEIIRTTVNMTRMVAEDLKSDNPKIRALGRKRAAGMALVSGGFYALSAMTAAALGVGDDEEEALRDLSAPWSKNSTFLFTGRDADGKLRFFDMSFLDPYGYLKRPLTAMLRNQPWEDAAVSGLKDILSPFFGADIAAGAIFEVMANQKPTGGKVFNEDAGSVDQLQDIASHMRKALQPGFMSNAERLWKAGNGERHEGSGQPYDMRDEVVALLGWRAGTLDTQTGLYYKSFEFTDALANAKKTLTRTLRSSNDVSDGDIRESKEAANAQYQKAFAEMGRIVNSASAAGMTRQQIARTLKLSGVSQRNIFALINGRVPPIDIGVQTQRNAVTQAAGMRDMGHAQEIARRFALARQT